MSLREIVEVVPADQAGAVHFIAIGGAGMSGIADFYHALGARVSGCDRDASPTLNQLAASGIETHVGHDPAHLVGIDTVVVSSAIRSDNPELVAATEQGLRVWHRSAALAALMVGSTGVAIAGAHGKTTTSGMCAVLLGAAGADPSYVIGAPLAATGTSSHRGDGEVFVVEADESDGSFLQYPTQIAVITNIEPDHLDNWGSPQAYFEGFRRFAGGDAVRAVVINADDAGARELTAELRAAGGVRVVSYGEAPDADLRITEIELQGTTASATLREGTASWPLELQVPGRYNLANAAAAFAVGRLLGLDAAALLAGARTFTGTLRRFQLVAQLGLAPDADLTEQVRIYDDYAHHPTELRAALSAARRARGSGRLVACFQPHLYSRTKQFSQEFGEALNLADVVVVTDVYGAREDPMPGVTGELIATAAARQGGAEVHYVADKGALAETLAELARPGDLIMTLGAGDVTLVGPLLVRALADRSQPR